MLSSIILCNSLHAKNKIKKMIFFFLQVLFTLVQKKSFKSSACPI
ncbi:hypothetical protein MtrunA17_Chr6g0450261 [Medicago truncatula]|uniref:Uncharacterized protein n=1 Tax=Medicago truncatula TaxID=3880 RepID=A0A396H918_MEDTR|nr:hypothetical protein MtrunA17_Chr6g0450261 [Medicago truncatula]